MASLQRTPCNPADLIAVTYSANRLRDVQRPRKITAKKQWGVVIFCNRQHKNKRLSEPNTERNNGPMYFKKSFILSLLPLKDKEPNCVTSSVGTWLEFNETVEKQILSKPFGKIYSILSSYLST